MGQAKLLGDRRFFPLFWTQFFGAFNDNFLKNATIILLTFRATGVLGMPPGEMVSVAAGLFVLPFFLFSATAGQLADKYEKARLVRIIKLCEIGIMLIAAYGFVTASPALLLGVLGLLGLHSTFFGPIKYSILPQLLGEDELIGANALIGAGTFLSILLGTIAGGVLVAIPERGGAYVGATLLAVALLGVGASRKIPEARAVAPDLEVQWNPITPTWAILGATRKNRAVFLSILGISWFWFFGAAILSLFPPYCREVLNAGEGVVTLFLACFSVGIAVGALLCERMSRRGIELGLVPLGSIGISAFAFDLAAAGRPEAFHGLLAAHAGAWAFIQVGPGLHVLADLVLLSIFSGFYIVPLNAMIQNRAEPTQRSRIIAGNNILNALFMVLSSVMTVSMMKLSFTIPQIFFALATLNAIVAAYIYTLLPEFLLRFGMWVVANVMYRLRVVGSANIPDRGAALLVCNHVSFVDWLIIGAAIHRPVRFVMHHSFARGWFGRWLMRRAKVIPIASAKEDPVILEMALEKIAHELRDQELVCIFPEGQITRDGQLNPFKAGVERIIARSPVPVVPMALHGMWGSFFSRQGGPAMSKGPRRLWSRVGLSIGPAVAAPQVSTDALRATVAGMLR